MSTMLAHTLLQDSTPPERWALFLHGILGRGSNLRSLARGWLAEAPGWGAVLVDLRQHGASQGFAPPHSLATAAQDVAALAASLPGLTGAVIGHSFGGKVALAYAAKAEKPPAQLWLLDSDPGPRGNGLDDLQRVFAFLRSCPSHFASRAAFVETAQRAGFSPMLAGWLATLLEPQASGLRLSIDLEAIEAMFADYAAQDLWPLLESPKALGDGLLQQRHIVVGGKSAVFDATRRHKLASMDAEGLLHMHVVAEAGHWLHTEAPEAMLALLHRHLR